MAAGSSQMTPGRIAPSAVSPQARDGRLRFMTRFIRVAALYNASGVLVLLTPGVLELLGVDVPAPFWVWLGGLMGLFAGVVLFLSAADLTMFGAFPYWNGLIRLVFVIATFSLAFGSDAAFFALLAVGDIPLAAVVLFGLPRALERTPWQLLTNQLASRW
jgi:hypothetical protein